jgi:hypothetical protein
MREYTVAADRMSRMVLPASYKPGSHLPQGAQRVPEKWGHAVVTDSTTTLCGRPVKGLFRFDHLLFEHLNRLLRCPVCDEEAGHPRRSRS